VPSSGKTRSKLRGRIKDSRPTRLKIYDPCLSLLPFSTGMECKKS
jgi:hypothetical protein